MDVVKMLRHSGEAAEAVRIDLIHRGVLPPDRRRRTKPRPPRPRQSLRVGKRCKHEGERDRSEKLQPGHKHPATMLPRAFCRTPAHIISTGGGAFAAAVERP